MMPIPENGGGAARGDENQRALALSLALELRKAREVTSSTSQSSLTEMWWGGGVHQCALALSLALELRKAREVRAPPRLATRL